MTGKKSFWFFISVAFFGFIVGCGTLPEDQGGKRDWSNLIKEKNIVVWSIYGSKPANYDSTVDIKGWEADVPQTLFAVDDKNSLYFMSYVIPEELAIEVGAKNLSYFYQRERVNIDERTTALALVIMSPPYFWMFSPKALVYVADKVVVHPKFEELVRRIAEINSKYPGSLTQTQDIYILASKIAEDVRKSIQVKGIDDIGENVDKGNRITWKEWEGEEPGYTQGTSNCVRDDEIYFPAGAPKPRTVDSQTIEFKSQTMVYYGGGFIDAKTPWDTGGGLKKTFVVKAQNGKIDLSLSNIISFNFINPKVYTSVSVPQGMHLMKISKGWEMSWSIFTDPVKRIGLVANTGRIVKFVIEIVVPNIAACIPDGDTWGWVASTITNWGLPDAEKMSWKSIIDSGAWDEILNLLSQTVFSGGGFIKWLLNKLGFSGCGQGVNFIINQLAATLQNFPIVKIYQALTRWIPFGIELFTKPANAGWLLVGSNFINASVAVSDVNPRPPKTTANLKMDFFGASCNYCGLEIVCPNGSMLMGFGTLRCGESKYVTLPSNLYGNCKLNLRRTDNYALLQSMDVTIEKCPTNDCSGWTDPVTQVGEFQKEGGGCAITSSFIWLFALISLIVIFIRRNEYYKKCL